ncbi:hypothetical protein M422DRAFT_34057 [Sphaerobolus stellatus SS14]|uniref:Unplaced genomic scaffold SPHSTscaffold_99, whole genome shotgun sequence n=1 Tax=Sphaerobolus stellatus (strain SS14) TaxID=990650 RepID=A0A0C9VH54_SPHS4|nr:hypothetical protein M422DRAFT_34057 [Sphaerobolus stellatus SS14]
MSPQSCPSRQYQSSFGLGFQSRSRRLWYRRELGCRSRIMLVHGVVKLMLDIALNALLRAAVVKDFMEELEPGRNERVAACMKASGGRNCR